MQYHHSTPYQQSMSSWTNSTPSTARLVVSVQQEGWFVSGCQGVCNRSPPQDQSCHLLLVGVGVCHQS